jgi:hypothetical protein
MAEEKYTVDIEEHVKACVEAYKMGIADSVNLIKMNYDQLNTLQLEQNLKERLISEFKNK